MGRFLTALFSLLICCSSVGAAQVKPSRVRVSEAVMQGMLTKKTDPQPPADAARVASEVVFRAVIDEKGDIESLQVTSGHPLLTPAAIDAVKQWKYKPFKLNGTAVKVETTIRVSFPGDGKDAQQEKK